MRTVALRIVGGGAAVAGLVDVLAAATPSPGGPFGQAASALGAESLPRPETAMLGLGMITLASGLARRRKLAWWGAIVALCAMVLAGAPEPRMRVLLVGVLALLVAGRGEFRTAPDPDRVRSAAWIGAGVLGVAAAVAGWGVLSHREVASTLVVGVLAVGLLIIVVVALTPAPAPAPGTASQRRAVQTLANHADADSLAPFAARQDKSYVFSPDGRAAIGYRVVLGTALAAGDPVGEAAQAPAAVAAFLSLCRERGWRLGVLGASAPAVELWRAHGLCGLVIGDEAVLDVATFTLSSRRMRNVRQAISRTVRAGVEVQIGPMTTELGRELRGVLDDWLAGRRIRGFSMNLDQILVPRPDGIIAVARTATGDAVAFAHFAVCANGRTVTLDIAPRRPDAPNGVVERLIVAMVDHARTIGADEVSLNFAGLRRIFESDAVLPRTAAGVTRLANPWIELRPLLRFCAKFNPRWRSRSLMVGSWFSLGIVGAAAIAIEMSSLRSRPQPAVPPGEHAAELSADLTGECQVDRGR